MVSATAYLQRHRVNGRINWPSVLGEPLLVPMLVVLAVVWLLPHNPYPNRFKTAVTDHVLSRYQKLPSVHFDASPSQSFLSRFPANKTALYIEPQADIPFMVPLLLHMMMVVPPDWRFVFFGSKATVDIVRGSYTAAMHERLGKLHIRDLSERWGLEWGRAGWEEEGKIATDEIRSRLLTNLTFYERELPGTEWLLVFHSDAILCANAETSVDDWLGYDWVGAPWIDGNRYGGNGGLSIRRMSKVIEVLNFQKREHNSVSEDQWMSGRLNTVPGAKMCPPDKAREFAVADIWHEWPLGFHVNPGGLAEGVWKPVDRRYQIYSYCPEVKIILDMALDREKCQEQLESEQKESREWQEREAEKKKEEDKKTEEEKEQLEEAQRAKEQAEKDAVAEKKKQKQAALEAARSRKAAVASSLKAAAALHAEKYAAATGVLAVASPPPARLQDNPLLNNDASKDESGASSDRQGSDSGLGGKDNEPDEFASDEGSGDKHEGSGSSSGQQDNDSHDGMDDNDNEPDDFVHDKGSSDKQDDAEVVAADDSEDSESNKQDDNSDRSPVLSGGHQNNEELDEEEDDSGRKPLVLGGSPDNEEADEQDAEDDSEPAGMDEYPGAE